MMLAAGITAAYAGFLSHTLHTSFALAVLTLAAATSRMKVNLPGINGNMSVNLPFLLVAVVSLSAAEAVVVQHAGIGAGNRHLVPGADGSGSWHRRSQRRESGRADLVEPGSSLVPLLCGQCGRNLDAAGSGLSPGLGIGAGGVPGDVRNSPLLPSVLREDGGNAAGSGSRSGRRGGRVDRS